MNKRANQMDLNQQQKDELLGRLLSGGGSRGDDAELERRLDQDAAFRRQFFAALDMKLAIDRNRPALARELADLAPAAAPAPARSRMPWFAAAAATFAIVAGSVALYMRNIADGADAPAQAGGLALKSLAAMGACYTENAAGKVRSAELAVCDLELGRRGALLRLFPQSAAIVHEDERGLSVELTRGAALLSSPRQTSDYTVQILAAERSARFLGTAVFVRIQESGARSFLVIEGQAEVSERRTHCQSSGTNTTEEDNSVVVDAGRQIRDRESTGDEGSDSAPDAQADCQLAVEEISPDRRADFEANVVSLQRSATRRAAQRNAEENPGLTDEDISAAARVIRSEMAEGLRYEVKQANGATLTGVLFQSGAYYVVLTDDGKRVTLQAVQVKEIRVINPAEGP